MTPEHTIVKEAASSYEPPYTIDQIRKEYGDDVRKAQVGFDSVTPEQIKALATGLNKKD